MFVLGTKRTAHIHNSAQIFTFVVPIPHFFVWGMHKHWINAHFIMAMHSRGTCAHRVSIYVEFDSKRHVHFLPFKQ